MFAATDFEISRCTNDDLMDKWLHAGAALLLSNCYENSAYHLTHYYGFQFNLILNILHAYKIDCY